MTYPSDPSQQPGQFSNAPTQLGGAAPYQGGGYQPTPYGPPPGPPTPPGWPPPNGGPGGGRSKAPLIITIIVAAVLVIAAAVVAVVLLTGGDNNADPAPAQAPVETSTATEPADQTTPAPEPPVDRDLQDPTVVFSAEEEAFLDDLDEYPIPYDFADLIVADAYATCERLLAPVDEGGTFYDDELNTYIEAGFTEAEADAVVREDVEHFCVPATVLLP